MTRKVHPREKLQWNPNFSNPQLERTLQFYPRFLQLSKFFEPIFVSPGGLKNRNSTVSLNSQKQPQKAKKKKIQLPTFHSLPHPAEKNSGLSFAF